MAHEYIVVSAIDKHTFTADDERFQLRLSFDDATVQYYEVWRTGRANALLERIVPDNTHVMFARLTIAPSGITLDGKTPEDAHNTWQMMSHIESDLSDLPEEFSALMAERMWHLQHGADVVCHCAFCRVDEIE